MRRVRCWSSASGSTRSHAPVAEDPGAADRRDRDRELADPQPERVRPVALAWRGDCSTPIMDSVSRRQFMVDRTIRRRGVRDPRVLAAVADVPREAFLPPELAELAYDDRPLPIGVGQTISQPYIVAAMAEALQLGPNASETEDVLEIGTGSG